MCVCCLLFVFALAGLCWHVCLWKQTVYFLFSLADWQSVLVLPIYNTAQTKMALISGSACNSGSAKSRQRLQRDCSACCACQSSQPMFAYAPSWASLAIEFSNVVLANAADIYAICLAFLAHAAQAFMRTFFACPSAFVTVGFTVLTLPSATALQAIPIQFSMRTKCDIRSSWCFLCHYRK